MRLINVKTKKLSQFPDDGVPPYAILSHTWGDEEVTFIDVEQGEVDKKSLGSIKFHGCRRLASLDGIEHVWIDTCCINKTDSVELSEAINSMFQWYQGATRCYAYLHDVPAGDNPRAAGSKFRTSRWFQRGWTLQELLAPRELRFYDSEWQYLGSKGELCSVVQDITGVPRRFLLGIAKLHSASVAQRMSWAAKRETTKREDLAYCLQGIFDVKMSPIYGEGSEQAFLRLQEQIIKNCRDDSILAWSLDTQETSSSRTMKAMPGRILAATPSDFANSGNIICREEKLLEFASGSLRIEIPLISHSLGNMLGLLNCGPENEPGQVVGIPLARTALKSREEYFKPSHWACVLYQTPTSDTLAQVIHIRNNNQTIQSTVEDQQYWCYEAFAELGLDLISVEPQSVWDKERALIVQDADTRLICARFRHCEEGSDDFLVLLDNEPNGAAKLESQCWVMICSRITHLDEVIENLGHVSQVASGKRSASNSSLHLQVSMEPTRQQPRSIIAGATLRPLDETLNITYELEKLTLLEELGSITEERQRMNIQLETLSQSIDVKFHQLKEINSEEREVERQLRELETKKKTLLDRGRAIQEESQILDMARDSLVMEHEENFNKWSSSRNRLRQLMRRNNDQDVDYVQRVTDQIALDSAVKHGDFDVVRELIDKAVDITVPDECGQPPIIVASSNGHYDLVGLLLSTPATDPDMRDNHDRTALSFAAERGNEAIVKLLIEVGANLEIEDDSGRSALSYATEAGHEAVVLLLCEKLTATDHLWKTWRGHKSPVQAMIFSSDSKYMLSVTADGTSALWATATGDTFSGFLAHINSIAFTQDSRQIVGVVDGGDIVCWDIAAGKSLSRHPGVVAVRHSRISPDANLLLLQSRNSAHPVLYRRESSSALPTPNGINMEQLVFSHDSKYVAWTLRYGAIRIWDTDTEYLRDSDMTRAKCSCHVVCIVAIQFSHDSNFIASASSCGTIRVWHTATGHLHTLLRGTTEKINSVVCFSHDLKFVAFASLDNIIMLWDLTSGQCQQRLQGHSNNINSIIFDENSKDLASASSDSTVKLWDIATGRCKLTLEGHNGPVRTLIFSPGSTILASASDDHSVKLWKIDSST
jgi:ankyrin repeat protein